MLQYEDSLKRFKMTFKKSEEFGEKAKNVIPGSYSRKTFNYGSHAIYVDRGEGAYIYTIEGKKLLDFNNNFTVNVLGQNHPAINHAIEDTLKNGFSFGNPTSEEYELAKMLSERIPSFEKVKFFCSASEAALGALRIARGYTGKTKIAKFEGGYHGFTDPFSYSAHPLQTLAGDSLEKINPLPESGGIPKLEADQVIILTQNNLEICEKLLRENAKDLACVIMELESCSGGIVVLDKEFVRRIREITKELGILLIFDETITIRAHRGGFQSEYGVTPDLTVTGKTIGGGLPIGAVGGSNEVMQVVENDQVSISGTHHGHRLACAAGIACLKTLTNDVYDTMNQKAKRIKKELNTWALKKEYPFTVYGEFSVLGYAFTKKVGQRIHTHRDYWSKTDKEKMQIYALEIATRGIFPVHRGQLGLTVPMTDQDITYFIETTKEIVEEIYNGR